LVERDPHDDVRMNDILINPQPTPLSHAPASLAEAEAGLNWYALYTCPRHEKCVAQQIEQRSISCFLPLYRSVRRWKDRRKELELALFPGYVFVRLALKDRLRVLQLPSAVRLVSFNGQPAVLPEAEIEQLRQRLARGGGVEPHPYLRVGRRVRVCGGPMQGLEGIIVRRKDRCRVVFSLDLIMRSVAVEVDESDVEPVAEWKHRN
jgi:transcription antitermination factor NusG